MRLDYKKLFLTITILIFFYLIGLKYITTHEFIHQQIFNMYNINYVSDYSYSLNGYTIAINNFSNCNDACKSMHVWNDIIGYYFSIFCILITIFYGYWWIR